MATLLLIFAILFFMGALVTTGKSIGASKVRKELESGKNYEPSETGDQPLACEALVTRVFEQRLVEAGIMEVIDMTICEDDGCRDCEPTRTAKFMQEKCAVASCRSKGTIKWNENEMLCQKHFDVRSQEEIKKKELSSKPNSTNKSARQGELKLNINHNGRDYTFDWPAKIPTYAAVSVANGYNRSHVEIMFKWTAGDGKQMGQRVMFPTMTWEPPTHVGSDPARKYPVRMTPERRKAAIEQLRKNPPKPPKGKGGGSPKAR